MQNSGISRMFVHRTQEFLYDTYNIYNHIYNGIEKEIIPSSREYV